MPKTNMEFNETDIADLVRNEVRAQHKLTKDHGVKTLVVIDRDEYDENPVVTVLAEFEKEVETKGSKKK